MANLLLLLALSLLLLGPLGIAVWWETRQEARRALAQRAADAAERAREDAVLDEHYRTLPDVVITHYAEGLVVKSYPEGGS